MAIVGKGRYLRPTVCYSLGMYKVIRIISSALRLFINNQNIFLLVYTFTVFNLLLGDKCNFFPLVHNINPYRGVEVKLHSLVNLAIGGSNWSGSVTLILYILQMI
jgi:hypothetical protein